MFFIRIGYLCFNLIKLIIIYLGRETSPGLSNVKYILCDHFEPYCYFEVRMAFGGDKYQRHTIASNTIFKMTLLLLLFIFFLGFVFVLVCLFVFVCFILFFLATVTFFFINLLKTGVILRKSRNSVNVCMSNLHCLMRQFGKISPGRMMMFQQHILTMFPFEIPFT